MNLKEITYFAHPAPGRGICANDFDNEDQIVQINLDFMVSLTAPQTFKVPLSGEERSSYSILTTSNNDNYYLREKEYEKLTVKIDMKSS